jgi:N-acetyl sugar amidotransferase
MYQICNNCIMDTSDPLIRFDESGRCHHCTNFYKRIRPNWNTDEQGAKKLAPILDRIRKEGRERDHDCLIGVSGGLDSSYLTYVVKEKFGLRPMLYHVDAGWNNQRAVSNIEKLVDGLNLDLYTEVINWDEMRDLQVAFLKSQIPDQDIPQDLAFFSSLYNYAAKLGHKYILTGGNYSTECVREPLEWGGYYATDMRLVRDIHTRFGRRPLTTFPTADIFRYKIYYRWVKGVQMVKVLNYVPFIKTEAEELMGTRFGWERFQHKHHESRFTRFYESYWLPKKFGFEKRRAHFSSLILTGQMRREEALRRIASPELDDETIKQEFAYVARKLGMETGELQQLFEGENRSYRDYRNNMKLISAGAVVAQLLGVENRRFDRFWTAAVRQKP